MTKEGYIKSIWKGFLLNVRMQNNGDSLVKVIEQKAPFKLCEYRVEPKEDGSSNIILDFEDTKINMKVTFRPSTLKGIVVKDLE